MTTEKFSIIIASVPDRERPVAEIAYGNVQWAEISYEKDEIIVQFYPHTRHSYWEFNLEEALNSLLEAKKFLLEE